MTKFTVFLTITLTVLVLAAGCEPDKSAPVDTIENESLKGIGTAVVDDSNDAAAAETEPAIIEPVQAEPLVNEPNETGEAKADPNVAESVKTVPVEIDIDKDAPDKTSPDAKAVLYDKISGILTDFVDENGMVDYARLRRQRLKLDPLLDDLKKLDAKEYKKWSKEDKIAFWLNTYNIQMLDIIVQNYPIESKIWHRAVWGSQSIRHIPPVNRIGVSKWNEYKFIVMQEEFNLATIEQRFFREEFGDPRVWFAACLASIGGPPLLNEPYCGDRLDRQLDKQIRRFLDSGRALKIDRQKEVVFLYSFFQPNDYGKDFIPKFKTDKKFKDHPEATRAVLNFITNYTSKQDVKYLETGTYKARYINYNWKLNDQNN